MTDQSKQSDQKPTHTPGPFIATKGTEDEAERWTVGTEGPRSWLIATIENGAPGDTLETEGANARLFAAAPDLLAACISILEWYDLDVERADITYARFDALRAAIAKATENKQ